jgi:vacuolar-type H+-ATPase subunit I/STV1
MKSIFSTSLFALRNLTRNKPDFLLKELEAEFCKWLDGSEINADNCPSELSQCLVNISQVLKGKGEEFVKARRKEVDENIAKMSKEEKEKSFYEAVTAYHEPLDNEDEKAKSLEGQTFRDVNNESKLAGNANRGEEVFKQIKERQQQSSSSFQPNNPQQRTNSEIIQDIRQNPRS